jgi:phosphoadenosine phosphosulfate reductase
MSVDLHDVVERHRHLEGDELLRPLLTGPLAGRLAVVSSFGIESAVLLHMVSRIDREAPVFFIDTGKLFVETLAYRSMLTERLGLTNVRVLRPAARDLAHHDPKGDLNARDPDQCCHVRKTLPLDRALAGYAGWVSGRKRYQGGDRTGIQALEVQDGRLKVDPLAYWGRATIFAYQQVHELPEHPLASRGYFSIGCMPCTSKAGTADDPRAGRWAGRAKTECGIHITRNGKVVRMVSANENSEEPEAEDSETRARNP